MALPEVGVYPIQRLLWPELGVSTEQHLYFRLDGPAGYSAHPDRIELSAGGGASFDTAANLFNLRTWTKACGLDALGLQIKGRGRFALTVFQSAPGLSWEHLYEELVTIPPDGQLDIDLTDRLQATGLSVLHFRLRALSDAVIDDAAWTTTIAPRRLPDLALSITTLARPGHVLDHVLRFEDFVATSPLRDHLHLLLIDPQDQLGVLPSDKVTPIVNRILKGAGGFAHGLHAAHVRGFSHCLFLNDAATSHMLAVDRCWWFMAYALDHSHAISGGLTEVSARWRLSHEGAGHGPLGGPHWGGTDLRDFGSVLRMEHQSSARQHTAFHGGWWFFAIAIDSVNDWPFPFHAPGDDVSFAVANALKIANLPGLVCFRDAPVSPSETEATGLQPSATLHRSRMRMNATMSSTADPALALAPIGDTAAYPIQRLLWPELGVSTEQHLYFRLSGPAGFSALDRRIEFAPGGGVNFDTSANLFNLRKWERLCDLSKLGLQLRGRGRFEITIFQVSPELSWERVHEDIATIPDDGILTIDLTDRLQSSDLCVLFFTLRALSDAALEDAAWTTSQAPLRVPKLALSITTFKREEAVAASVRRFEEFVAESPLRNNLHLFVVDNGNSAGLEPSAHFTPVINRNLGGSGGFARGLHEAHARDFTHCLFMDDDAKVHMLALERTWWFMAYAKDDSVAISGGLTQANPRWRLWENGANFDRHCFPHWLGTDLRDFPAVLWMEHQNSKRQPKGFYGGWWYFAFSIKGVRHWPFPFFVRGDDISFSIANDLSITTLPGIVCFQDADFSAKESLQTLYLDMRSHMVHHIVLPPLDRGRKDVLKIMIWFFIRSMNQMHYETLEALNLAAEDVLKGPGFFAENADMAARRATLGAIRKVEAWKPHNPDTPIPERRRFDPHRSRLRMKLLRYTLNGHLLPFFGSRGNRIVLGAGARGDLHPVWGASQITYLTEDGEQAFTVRHSKAKAYRQGFRMLRNLWRMARRYPALRNQWQSGYDSMTTETFWVETFKD